MDYTDNKTNNVSFKITINVSFSFTVPESDWRTILFRSKLHTDRESDCRTNEFRSNFLADDFRSKLFTDDFRSELLTVGQPHSGSVLCSVIKTYAYIVLSPHV